MSRPKKPPLRDAEPPASPAAISIGNPSNVLLDKIDFVALLRDLSGMKFSKEIAHAKADIILMAAMEVQQFTPAMNALAFQAKVAGYLIDRVESDVRVTLTPEQRHARIAELVEKGRLPANRNRLAG